MKLEIADLEKCPLCGEKVYITDEREGVEFYCDKRDLNDIKYFLRLLVRIKCSNCLLRTEGYYAQVEVDPKTLTTKSSLLETMAVKRLLKIWNKRAGNPIKQGQWIESEIPGEKYTCSICGGACWYYDYEGEVKKSRYCPSCGAKMELNGELPI